MRDVFRISDVKTFIGPNYELNQQAIAFDLEIRTEIDVPGIWEKITEKLTELKPRQAPTSFPELFARTVITIQQLGIGLFAENWAVRAHDNRYRVAVQYIDSTTGERSIKMTHEWISDLLDRREYPFERRMEEIYQGFYKSRFGGPTIYSIIEAGYKARIPMFYLKSEDVFQWGQGRKQLRGRSTVLHRDSIKDTELTTYKDQAKVFLEDLGFPVPKGTIVRDLDEAEQAAEAIGFPVVTKPVDGHKGQGVTTGINSRADVKMGFQIAMEASKNKNGGIIIEKMVTGTDHRLLTISGKFVGALQRIPAHVIGDGKHSLEQLIEIENQRPERADTPRSPLGKIKIDDILISFIREKGLSLRDIPKEGEYVVLRRVANISAGGVSVNVTDIIHPLNIKLAEDVARFLDVHVLGIDLLAEDISKPWTESPCSIIEINAGPGVFMHLVPARGESINVPELILNAFFPSFESARIPTIVFNQLPDTIARKLTDFSLRHPNVEEVGVSKSDGVFFNNQFFSKRPELISNIRNVIRNPHLDVALLEYKEPDILNEGFYHYGADCLILDAPTDIERVLARDLLPGAMVIEIDRAASKILIGTNGSKKEKNIRTKSIDDAVVEIIEPVLKKLIQIYNIQGAVRP